MKLRKTAITTAALCCAALLLAGCGNNDKETTASAAQTTSAAASASTAETTAAPELPDIENYKPVRLYEMDYSENKAVLVKEYSSQWSVAEDIGVFGAFCSEEDEIYFDSEVEAHQKDWDSISDVGDYKIGYNISFKADGEKHSITILSPADIEDSGDLFMGDMATDEVTGYLGVWVYDDYNQEGGWYSHVLPEEYNDDTLLTSIKLHPTPDSDKIEDLKLTVFSYSSPLEFDENMQYNGAVRYIVSIYNK